jgi:hypothetical protein
MSVWLPGRSTGNGGSCAADRGSGAMCVAHTGVSLGGGVLEAAEP